MIRIFTYKKFLANYLIYFDTWGKEGKKNFFLKVNWYVFKSEMNFDIFRIAKSGKLYCFLMVLQYSNILLSLKLWPRFHCLLSSRSVHFKIWYLNFEISYYILKCRMPLLLLLMKCPTQMHFFCNISTLFYQCQTDNCQMQF